MDDAEFEALKARVARLAAETATETEKLLAEIRRRDRGDATVTPIRPGGNSGP
jgi:cytidylate kinase